MSHSRILCLPQRRINAPNRRCLTDFALLLESWSPDQLLQFIVDGFPRRLSQLPDELQKSIVALNALGDVLGLFLVQLPGNSPSVDFVSPDPVRTAFGFVDKLDCPLDKHVLGEEDATCMAYVRAVDDLVDEGLVKQVGDNSYDLTTTGGWRWRMHSSKKTG